MFRSISTLSHHIAKPSSFNRAAVCVSKLNSRSFTSNAQVDPVLPQPKRTLHNEILQRIKVSGPLTVADYMKLVLTNPITVNDHVT